MKLGRKIGRAFIFLGVLAASLITSIIIVFTIGRLFFNVFIPVVTKPCVPINPGDCWTPIPAPVTGIPYPYNVLIIILAISFIAGVIGYSLLALKYLIKD